MNKFVTSSREMAVLFNVRHCNMLRKVREALKLMDNNFVESNFVATTRATGNTVKCVEFFMTYEGFLYICMSTPGNNGDKSRQKILNSINCETTVKSLLA